MVIAVVNQKGGTGKTTTTINLGQALAKQGKRVLLVDMDAQGSLGYSLGIMQPEKTISDIFIEDAALAEALHQSEGMDIIPSDVRLADVELSIADVEDRHAFLLNALSEVRDAYDFILIDCPPSLSLLTVNSLSAADRVLIPMQMEVLSLQGLDLISSTIRKIRDAFRSELKIIGILPVMVDKRRKLSAEVHEHIKENYDIYIFSAQIRPNVRASEAPSFGMSVISYAPDSNSAQDYLKFAEEFLTVI